VENGDPLAIGLLLFCVLLPTRDFNLSLLAQRGNFIAPRIKVNTYQRCNLSLRAQRGNLNLSVAVRKPTRVNERATLNN